MRREISNSELWLIERDLSSLRAKMPGVYFLLQTRVGDFFNRNKLTIHLLHKNVHQIQKKYIAHDEANDPQRVPGEGNEVPEWLFLESVATEKGEMLTGEAVSKAFYAELDEFLNRVVKVDL